MDRTLPRASRLRNREQFLEIYDHGTRVHAAFFVVFGVPGAACHTRLGITATKKVGNAVVRNRVKRIVREIFRHRRRALAPPLDVVVNVKSGAREQPLARLEGDLAGALRELSRRLAS